MIGQQMRETDHLAINLCHDHVMVGACQGRLKRHPPVGFEADESGGKRGDRRLISHLRSSHMKAHHRVPPLPSDPLCDDIDPPAEEVLEVRPAPGLTCDRFPELY